MKKIEFWAATFMCAGTSLVTIAGMVLAGGDSNLFAFIAFLPVFY